jgi:VanZ family protein
MIWPAPIRRTLLLACIVLWLGAAAATHTPAPRLPPLHTSDKVLHAGGYFVLGMAFLLTLRAYGWRGRWCILIAVPVLLAYGALDELTQPWVNRCAAWDDWLADGAGAALAGSAFGMGAWIRRIFTR